MDTLRTLSSAFLWSFVVTPAFAQTRSFDATSGSTVLRFTDAFPTFTVAGPGPIELCPPYDQRRPAVIERNWHRCLH